MGIKSSAVLVGVILTGLCSVHCSSGSTGESESQGAASSASSTAISKTVSSSYGITTFGGAGDYQAMACGGNSKTANKWYVASSQRYGCHVHLKLTASNGKCVVVSTEDAGPAAYVEKAAGEPILDSSPAVAEYLFGENGLGSSDVKANPSTYSVSASETSDAVGPCSASTDDTTTATAPTDDGNDAAFEPSSAPTASNTGDDDDAPAPAPAPTASNGDDDDDNTSGGEACGSDGQCNPGNDGSGLICSGGFCVPGCHIDAQCPGITTCVSGQCQ